jgi:hypothetical protein
MQNTSSLEAPTPAENVPALFTFYKIKCIDKSIRECYIGKTTNFANRMANHKCLSKTQDLKVYNFIREHGGWENWVITIEHKTMCDNGTAAYIEYALIQQCKPYSLNVHLPLTYPLKEYNRQKCQEHYKIIASCECGWAGSKMQLSHHKQSKRHLLHCYGEFQKEVAGANGPAGENTNKIVIHPDEGATGCNNWETDLM